MFSTTVKYAIKACVYMSLNYNEQRLIGVKELCEQTGMPRSYVSKVLHQLVKAGHLDSFKGVNGGYCLTKPPKELSLRAIIEAIEGDAMFSTCLLSTGKCSLHDPTKNPCELHDAFLPLLEHVSKTLDELDMSNALVGD